MTTVVIEEKCVIPVGEQSIDIFLARPTSSAPHPAVLVVHEVYGIYGHVDQVCRDLAALGYVAVAPSLFTRYGDVHRLTRFEEIHAISRKVPDSEVMTDLDATFAWMQSQDFVAADRIGATGFCWGGRQVWLYAAHNAALRAGVAWYGGRLVADPSVLRPRNPLDIVAELKSPVLGLYGAADDIISLESIHAMQDALASHAPESAITLFPDTPHGFHASNRPSYTPVSAEAGWHQMADWFKRYL